MDFSKLSGEDLNEFLSQDYGVSIDRNLSRTELAEQTQHLFNQLKHKNILFPYPVVDLYLASLYQGPRDKTYTYYQITNLTPNEIDMFSRVLGFKSTNPSLDRDRIFRILTYLGLIDISEELIQPHILDYLCQTLSVDDLNNYRLANDLDEIDCQLNINYKENYLNKGPKVFNELNDTTYSLIELLRTNEVRKVINKVIDENDDVRLEYLLQTGFKLDRNMYIKIVRNRRLELVKMALEYGYKPYSFLYPAISEGNLEIVKYLVDQGIDLNKIGRFYHPPLTFASQTGNLEMVKLFVDHVADISQINDNGASALIHAVESGNLDLIKYLVDKGIDVNAQIIVTPNSNLLSGYTPLDMLEYGRSTIVRKYGSKNYNKIETYLKSKGAKHGDELP